MLHQLPIFLTIPTHHNVQYDTVRHKGVEEHFLVAVVVSALVMSLVNSMETSGLFRGYATPQPNVFLIT